MEPEPGGVSGRLAKVFKHPAIAVYTLVVPLALLAWSWMFLAAKGISASNAGASLGPSMQLFDRVFKLADFPLENGWIAWVIAICTPTSSAVGISMQSVAIMFLMWFAMVLAMMLPSAAPMLRTYAEIAETAAQKRETVISLVVLAAGYIVVWTGFAIAATLFQSVLIIIGGESDISTPLAGFSGGIVLVIAGLYQFTPLKNACLVKCRNPFSTLFGQWSTTRAGVLRLGMKEGLYCLGCCWAIMLVMLAVGTMNLVWMLFLTLFTILEKSGAGLTISGVFGVVLLLWGLFLLLTSASLTFS